MESFFVSCPPGFENELTQEIQSFWFQLMDLDGLPTRHELPEFTAYTGGVEFKTPQHLGFQINFFSKIGLRVLWRLGSFEARYFDQFEKGLSKINLEKHLDPQPLNIQIESAQSRLFHEKNLLESTGQVLARRKYTFDKEASVKLFVRIVKDKVMVSLDTSGEHLHFRGYRKQQGEAPLRENLASLILQMAKIDVQQESILFDPYCGSGTFFFEAYLKGLPNFERHYSFLNFKSTPAIFKSSTWKKNYRWINFSKKIKCIGFEKNPETYKKSLSNLEYFIHNYSPTNISFFNEDSENLSLSELERKINRSAEPVTVVTNPPYGERSKAEAVRPFLEKLEQLPQLQKLVIIHPDYWTFNFKKMNKVLSQPLSNQGLKTVLSVFKTKLPP